jgi:hypothetical protein
MNMPDYMMDSLSLDMTLIRRVPEGQLRVDKT